MPFEIQQKIIGECEVCGRTETEKETAGFLGIIQAQDEAIGDFLENLEIEDLEIERASYEEIKLYCPHCAKEREAAERWTSPAF